VVAAVALGCGDEDHGSMTEIFQDNASDEVLLALLDAETEGQITIDDGRCAQLTHPLDGEIVTTNTTFTWNAPAMKARHGTDTGTFIWMKLSGGGLDAPIHVLSISSRSWTPDADMWNRLVSAGGPITVTMTTAAVDAGVIREGPFRASLAPAFTPVGLH